jgi:hypothetical protein
MKPYDPLVDPPPIPWGPVAFLAGMGALAGASIGYMLAGFWGAVALGIPGALAPSGYILLRLLVPWWRVRRIWRERLREEAERRHDGNP